MKECELIESGHITGILAYNKEFELDVVLPY